jgi:putative ABC transport system permease protein
VILQSYNEMSVVFHPVPGVGEPESLFALQTPISFPDFERYSSSNDGPFAAVAPYKGPVPLSIRREGTTERVWSHIVTPHYFEVLKACTVVGDTFSKIEESAGTAGVIISEGYWQRHFGGSHDVVGRALIINGESANIIGVAGKDFIGASPLISMAEIWIPTIPPDRPAEIRNHAITS